MISNLYLIAHKVRGETALDIAEPMEMADGTWWIIPTSGHRAYPYWTQRLATILNDDIGDPPQDLRDHYQITETVTRAAAKRQSVDSSPKLEDL